MTIKDKIEILLSGGDLRSISGANNVLQLIHNQEDFDILFEYLYNGDRLITMRAVDSIEKISKKHNTFLNKYKLNILELLRNAEDKELKWHLAQLVSRLNLNNTEQKKVFKILAQWVQNKDESKIVRVNSIQALSEISYNNESLGKNLEKILNDIAKENIPSINARIKHVFKNR